jgi:hypothetical protein
MVSSDDNGLEDTWFAVTIVEAVGKMMIISIFLKMLMLCTMTVGGWV